MLSDYPPLLSSALHPMFLFSGMFRARFSPFPSVVCARLPFPLCGCRSFPCFPVWTTPLPPFPRAVRSPSRPVWVARGHGRSRHVTNGPPSRRRPVITQCGERDASPGGCSDSDSDSDSDRRLAVWSRVAWLCRTPSAAHGAEESEAAQAVGSVRCDFVVHCIARFVEFDGNRI